MHSTPRRLRLAAVGFVNARPLLHGLDARPDVVLSLDVPSRLLDRIGNGQADVALLPVIDLQRLKDAVIVPAGGIGCDGPTLTVRLFSQRPFDNVTRLACDPDSHTSVVLSRIVLKRVYGSDPEIVPLGAADGRPGEARLLIGDKVVCEEPAGFDYQLDLGGAWKRLTGLPFVFAVWATRRGVDLGTLPDDLAAARVAGCRPDSVARIIERDAVPRGWPAGLALQYLTTYLKYDVGPRQLEAIRRFHRLAADDGLIPPPTDVPVYGVPAGGPPSVDKP